MMGGGTEECRFTYIMYACTYDDTEYMVVRFLVLPLA